MRNPHRPFFGSFKFRLGILIGLTIAPAGQVALASSEELAAMQAAPVAMAEAAPTLLTGQQVYNAICIACHAPPGIGGAPALGDGDAWAPRIAQGAETMIHRALHGFSGSTGIMPRKGGRLDFSDEEVIAAVEYMIEQAAQ